METATETGVSRLVYEVDEKPKFLGGIVFAFQHLLTAFAGIIAPPLIIGGAIGLAAGDVAFFVNACLLGAGIATIINTIGFKRVGAKLPCVMGTEFTFVVPAILAGSMLGLPGIIGGTVVCSLVEVVFSQILPWVRRLFPPLVTGTLLLIVGLTLIPVAIDWSAGGYGSPDYGSLQNLGIAFFVLLIIIVMNQLIQGRYFINSIAILAGLVAGYVVAWFLGMVDFSVVGYSGWFHLPVIFRYGIALNLPIVLLFSIGYVVSAIDSIGVLSATAEASRVKIDTKRLSGGLLADAIGSMVGGVFGATPNTNFAQNVGLISITGVASRFVVAITGIMLVILSLFPKLGAIVATMPPPVLGGAGLVMFGMVAIGGLRILRQVEFTQREGFILAIAITLGVGVTVRPDLVSNFPETLRVLFTSGISVGALVAIILNQVIPGRQKVEFED